MAGHSKWANIKHRKGAQDAKRGKIFTKIIREITVGAKMGDPDPATNPRLRLAVDKALAVNMPKDTIQRAIQRGAGNAEGENYEELTYEGYGAGGVAIMVACMTDNRNRTVGEVRHAFSKCGGNLGTDGSVAYLFNKVGVFSYESDEKEDEIIDVALEAGAEDVVVDENGSLEVITAFEDYLSIKEVLEAANLVADNAETTMRAETLAAIDAKTAEKVLRLVDMLEDLDDVQAVYSNADISDEIMEQLAEA